MYSEIPIIVIIVASLLTVYKSVVSGKENLIRIIPLLAVLLGMILGIVAFYAAPAIVNADNVFVAMVHGITSGLAATGCHQLIKQLSANNSGTIKPPDEIYTKEKLHETKDENNE